jgi:uncharacterized membrane protein
MQEDSPQNPSRESDLDLPIPKPPPITSSDEAIPGQKSAISLERRAFFGPLPPPEMLKAYDIVQPGLAQQIFELAQTQAEHRMELEKAVVFGDGRRSWVGLLLGFIIACLFLGSSTYIIVQGHDLAGGILGGSGLVSLVSVFIYGTNARSKERAEKRDALLGRGADQDQARSG